MSWNDDDPPVVPPPRGRPEERLARHRAQARNSVPREEVETFLLVQAALIDRLCHNRAKVLGIDGDDLKQTVNESVLRDCDVDSSNKGYIAYIARKVRWAANQQLKARATRTEAYYSGNEDLIALWESQSGAFCEPGREVELIAVPTLVDAFRLTRPQAEVVALQVGGFGLTLKEIARRVGRSEEAVRQMNRRATQKMQDALGEATEIDLLCRLHRTGSHEAVAYELATTPEDVRHRAERVLKSFDTVVRKGHP